VTKQLDKIIAKPDTLHSSLASTIHDIFISILIITASYDLVLDVVLGA